jgi:DNA-binding FadR family transcriptional regulator
MMNNRSAAGAAGATRLDRAILQLVAKSGRPVGQGSLSFLLRRQGVSVSAPTIGRRLRDLEFTGMLRRVSVEGRVITERGRRILGRWQAEAHFRTSGQALLDTLRRGDKNHLLDLLAARRVVETEAAALAATHASADAVARMEAALAREVESIRVGGLGAAEDAQFHQEIGRASGNAVLASLISLMRHNQRYNWLVTSMRAVVGGRLAVDHRAILHGIKRRNPRAARQAMERHLRNLERDLDRYWARYAGPSAAAAGQTRTGSRRRGPRRRAVSAE